MGPAKIDRSPVIISVCLIVIVEFAARSFNLSPLLTTGAARIIDILILLGVFYLSSGSIAALGLSTGKIKQGIQRGILWSVIFGMISGCVGIVFIITGINPFKLIHVSMPKANCQVAMLYIVGGVIGPVAEEMFFRGVIYGYLRNRLFTHNLKMAICTAIFVSTFFFVFAHFGNSGIPLPQLVGGVVFCLAYEVEKSLLTPIVIHSLGNMALFTLSLI